MTDIGKSFLLKGEITSDEDLTILGRVQGQITVRNAVLTIAPDAQVEAEIQGTKIQVLGGVNGAIAASERVELGPSANVTGSLRCAKVVILEGALFNGQIEMADRTAAPKVAQFKATQTS